MLETKVQLRKEIKHLENFQITWTRYTSTEIDLLLEKHQKPKVTRGVHIRLGLF